MLVMRDVWSRGHTGRVEFTKVSDVDGNLDERGMKHLREEFAKFLEQPDRVTLRDLLRSHVGESDQHDFKEEWPPLGPKLARHVLGFANSGGGILVLGVKEHADGSMEAIGLRQLTDKATVHNAITTYIPDGLECDVGDFCYTESEYERLQGKMFQVLFVENCPEHLPFLASRDGDGIKESVVYVRAGTSTRPATHHQLQSILNRRIATGHSTERALTLRAHLDELKMLYDERRPRPLSIIAAMAFAADPRDTYEDFIEQLIASKQRAIEQLLLR